MLADRVGLILPATFVFDDVGFAVVLRNANTKAFDFAVPQTNARAAIWMWQQSFYVSHADAGTLCTFEHQTLSRFDTSLTPARGNSL